MSDEILPEHIQNAVRASAELRNEHFRSAAPLTKLITFITNRLASPEASVGFLLFALIWIFLNLEASHVHFHPFDEPPFPVLALILGFSAVGITLIILTAQQHENILSDRRAKLTLDLVIVNDQKLSKIILMLDALRKDMPDISTHIDPEVIALSVTSTPQETIQQFQASQQSCDIGESEQRTAHGSEARAE